MKGTVWLVQRLHARDGPNHQGRRDPHGPSSVVAHAAAAGAAAAPSAGVGHGLGRRLCGLELGAPVTSTRPQCRCCRYPVPMRGWRCVSGGVGQSALRAYGSPNSFLAISASLRAPKRPSKPQASQRAGKAGTHASACSVPHGAPGRCPRRVAWEWGVARVEAPV